MLLMAEAEVDGPAISSDKACMIVVSMTVQFCTTPIEGMTESQTAGSCYEVLRKNSQCEKGSSHQFTDAQSADW